MIRVTVSENRNRGKFRVTLNGATFIKSTSRPLIDAGKKLVDQGHNGNQYLEMYRGGKRTWDLRAKLKHLAAVDSRGQQPKKRDRSN